MSKYKVGDKVKVVRAAHSSLLPKDMVVEGKVIHVYSFIGPEVKTHRYKIRYENPIIAGDYICSSCDEQDVFALSEDATPRQVEKIESSMKTMLSLIKDLTYFLEECNNFLDSVEGRTKEGG